ncbi:erythromycin esterase [Oceanobacillus piezotolerans]|uniref:Erythromycin esterase n=1 Tax=Oceanobacillus piezotolerans TaxID=2448030 RepID=A0A498DDY6_9BACI|nr:erythromycin esterase family protein [Oceanobacillus piezotolerans]RLL48286.1 erythromycin esterase [Oceanobacillus piezotolerans]
MALFSLGKDKYNKSLEWVKKHSYYLDSLSESSIEDFVFLENVLENKRIVWLGENGHGVAEHNLLKSKLIEFLYHKMGFRVIAFESGLTECYTANFLKDKLTMEDFIDKSVFSLWKTHETYPLFQFMKATNDMKMIGFDFQPSAKQGLLMEFLDAIPIRLNKDFKESFQHVHKASVDWYHRLGMYKARRKRVPKESLQAFERAFTELTEQIAALNQTLIHLKQEFHTHGLQLQFKVLLKILENKRLFLIHLTNKNRDYLKYRDQIMADNLAWLCQEIYPDEKIIIWAHNNHIYKNVDRSYKPMGTLISEELQEVSYYLGLYMYQGEAAYNKGNILKVSKPPKKSLEDFMNPVDCEVSFLDFSLAEQVDENSWLFRKTVYMDHGTMQTLIIPADQMDGAILVKEVSPAKYI